MEWKSNLKNVILKLLNKRNKYLVSIQSIICIAKRFDTDYLHCKTIRYDTKPNDTIFCCLHNDIVDRCKLKSILRCSYYIVTPLIFINKPILRAVVICCKGWVGHTLPQPCIS